ncbi:MAG: hypothetical protein A2X64_04490 [Ignavibacteria bacterium GWF2_33_9]|nr:MAG: hypothetical protein A2X64_04490 [Ignavibacteria bacterium GWF2_33_9]
MKKFTLLSLAILFAASSISFSQLNDEINNDYDKNALMFGPYLGWSVAGVNTTGAPTGLKVAVGSSSSPNFGIMVYKPTDISSNSGYAGLLGIKHVPYGYNNGAYKDFYDMSYFIVGGLFNLSGFTIGLDVSFPMTLDHIDPSYEVASNNLNITADLKLGGMFKLFENKYGIFNIFINAGYMVNEVHKNVVGLNPKPAHIEVGLDYLFNTSNF